MAIFGLLFIGMAVAGMVSRQSKATQYQAARRQYEAHRAKALRRLGSGDS